LGGQSFLVPAGVVLSETGGLNFHLSGAFAFGAIFDDWEVGAEIGGGFSDPELIGPQVTHTTFKARFAYRARIGQRVVLPLGALLGFQQDVLDGLDTSSAVLGSFFGFGFEAGSNFEAQLLFPEIYVTPEGPGSAFYWGLSLRLLYKIPIRIR